MIALHRAGIPVRKDWMPPRQVAPWDGPFANPTMRLSQHPRVARERAEAKRPYRLRVRCASERLRAWGRSTAPIVRYTVTSQYMFVQLLQTLLQIL
jgi:hypothetical protein